MASLTAAQRRVLERFRKGGWRLYAPDWRTTPKLIALGLVARSDKGDGWYTITDAGRKALEGVPNDQ